MSRYNFKHDEEVVKDNVERAIKVFRKELKLRKKFKVVYLHDNSDSAGGYIPCRDIIQLNTNRELTAILPVLAHEMIHVKQFVTRRLKYIGEGSLWAEHIWSWSGTQYTLNAHYPYPLACNYSKPSNIL